MPKSKNRKNHKKKVASRNQKISQEKRRVEKYQREFLMKLIEAEKQKGLFDNGTMSGPIIDTQIPNFEVVEGPNLDGPSI